jgi:hypothetical protein
MFLLVYCLLSISSHRTKPSVLKPAYLPQSLCVTKIGITLSCAVKSCGYIIYSHLLCKSVVKISVAYTLGYYKNYQNLRRLTSQTYPKILADSTDTAWRHCQQCSCQANPAYTFDERRDCSSNYWTKRPTLPLGSRQDKWHREWE